MAGALQLRVHGCYPLLTLSTQRSYDLLKVHLLSLKGSL
jgi:hypothetical protein